MFSAAFGTFDLHNSMTLEVLRTVCTVSGTMEPVSMDGFSSITGPFIECYLLKHGAGQKAHKVAWIPEPTLGMYFHRR